MPARRLPWPPPLLLACPCCWSPPVTGPPLLLVTAGHRRFLTMAATLTPVCFPQVQKLIKEAKALREAEADLVAFQLTEMSDRLPPLSKFGHGFKLDAWQVYKLSD